MGSSRRAFGMKLAAYDSQTSEGGPAQHMYVFALLIVILVEIILPYLIWLALDVSVNSFGEKSTRETP